MRLVLIQTALLLMLAACSSANPDEIVRQVGVVAASEDSIGGSASLAAYFIEDEDGSPAATARANFLTYTDSCTLTEISETDSDESGTVTAFGVSGSPISAGEVITISSAAGSFSELTRMGDSYESNTAPGYPLPAGLTVDIPGDVYPAFSAVSIPDASAFTVEWATVDEDAEPEEETTEAETSVNEKTEFTWEPDTDVDARVLFSATVVSTDPELPSNELECVILDDGTFAFPLTTQLQLGEDFQTTEFQMYREGRSIVQNDDVMLLLSHSLN